MELNSIRNHIRPLQTETPGYLLTTREAMKEVDKA